MVSQSTEKRKGLPFSSRQARGPGYLLVRQITPIQEMLPLSEISVNSS